MNKYYKYIITLSVLMISASAGYSVQEQKQEPPVKLNVQAENINQDIVAKNVFIKTKYLSAESRFLSGNVKASADNFEEIISKAEHDDYALLSYAIKMAEYGFFEQTEKLFNKLDKSIYTENYINEIKNFYYPSGMLDKKDLYALADALSAIMYNNQAIEMTSELMNNSEISESDYKNYLIALGFYKSNNLSKALTYINNATKENSTNINYKLLKAKILADTNKYKQAAKLMKEIKRTKFITVDFQTKVRSAEEYLQYKIEKNSVKKDYHLAYYYYLQGKNQLAIKVLQSLVLQAKDELADICALLGKIYYENQEPGSAKEFAQKAYNLEHDNYNALTILGNLNFDNRKYEDALKFYQKAYKKVKTPEAGTNTAKCYLALKDKTKTVKIYEKLLRKYPKNEDVLIGALQIYPHRADDYMARLAAVDISNNDIWLTLADLAIKDKNYAMAQTYLNNSYYIDENNFKYYYYLSLVLKGLGNSEKSKAALIKGISLNPDLYKELSGDVLTNDK